MDSPEVFFTELLCKKLWELLPAQRVFEQIVEGEPPFFDPVHWYILQTPVQNKNTQQ